MQQIDENSADFLFKLESVVRMVVQEISTPMIEKTKEAFHRIQTLLDILENHNQKHTGMQGHLSAIELKLNFKSHEIDTMQQKFYELNNQVVFTAKQNSQLIQDMQFDLQALNFRQKDKDELLGLLHQKADTYSSQVQDIWDKLNEVQTLSNTQLNQHQKEMYNQIATFQQLNQEIQQSLDKTKQQSQINQEVSQQLNAEIQRLKVQKQETSRVINDLRRSQETLVTLKDYENFKMVHNTELQSLYETMNNNFSKNLKTQQEMNNQIEVQISQLSKMVDDHQKQSLQNNDKVKQTILEAKSQFRSEIQNEQVQRDLFMNNINDKINQINTICDEISQRVGTVQFKLKREGLRLKDLKKEMGDKFINERGITNEYVHAETFKMQRSLTEELIFFVDQRCYELKQVMMQTPNASRASSETPSQQKYEINTQSQSASDLYNPQKFKVYVNKKLEEISHNYLTTSPQFDEILHLAITEGLQREKTTLAREVEVMQDIKNSILRQIEEQDTRMKNITKWLQTCEDDVRQTLDQTHLNSEIVKEKAEQIMKFKEILQDQVNHIDKQQDIIIQKITKTQNQGLQFKSDYENQHNYIHQQIQHLLKEKQQILSKQESTFGWLTVLTESINVSMSVLLQKFCEVNHQIAIPTQLEGILYQNYHKYDDPRVIYYRMNAVNLQNLLHHTLTSNQSFYSKLVGSLELKQTCLDHFKDQILQYLEVFKNKQILEYTATNCKTTNTDGDDDTLNQSQIQINKLYVRRTSHTERPQAKLLIETTASDNDKPPFGPLVNNLLSLPSERRIHSSSTQNRNRVKGIFLRPHQSKHIKNSKSVNM